MSRKERERDNLRYGFAFAGAVARIETEVRSGEYADTPLAERIRDMIDELTDELFTVKDESSLPIQSD